ncbi:MAG: GntR family transcriptional regulator [Stappiaceae bacterium]
MVVVIDPEAWTLDPTEAASRQLRTILRSRIVCNDLKPNSKISETEVAQHYDVSRQPVREAFITLVREGLLEIRPQRGTFVRKIDYSAVLDARFVREAVEADIVKLLADKSDPALVSELRSQLKQQENVSRTNPQKFIELDEYFHKTLADAAGKVNAWLHIDSLKSQMDRVRFLSFECFPIQTLIGHHEQIVDFIEKQDQVGAEIAMRRHLQEILKSLPVIRKLCPDYFENSQPMSQE